MSRVGKKPIEVPAGVEITVEKGRARVEGPKGTLETAIPKGLELQLNDGLLTVERKNDQKRLRALHGLVRSLLANSVTGVTTGFRKELDIVGIGYRAEVKGSFLNLALGYSHPIEFPVPEDVQIKVERIPRATSNYVGTVIVTGIDKYRVGQVAADLRSLRPPDAYKGKGIRYSTEEVKLKVGKKGA